MVSGSTWAKEEMGTFVIEPSIKMKLKKEKKTKKANNQKQEAGTEQTDVREYNELQRQCHLQKLTNTVSI